MLVPFEDFVSVGLVVAAVATVIVPLVVGRFLVVRVVVVQWTMGRW